MRYHFLPLCLLFIFHANLGRGTEPGLWYESKEGEFVKVYQWFHLNPEVSFQEKETGQRFAKHLLDVGYEVTREVGGYGVVGLLRNGEGPTVMLRTDLDALPVTEQTQLPYASTVKTELPGGGTSGVMHACGHDLHMTNILATAIYFAEHRSAWKGTLMVIGQPAEERGAGARAMLEDGLFTKFPKPDFALALHVDGQTTAGTVQVAGGFILANVDSVDITIQGRGGHGSAPHTTIDPIVQAAELIVSLQTIVSREVKPTEPAVVTVGAINGGTKHNIIPDTCHLQITVRSYTDAVRAQVLAAIERRAKGIAATYGAPEPEIQVSEGTPALENDAALAARMSEVFANTIGKENVSVAEQSMGGEDFSQYGRAGVPILMYRLGTILPERLARFQRLGISPPSLHSSTYHPDLELSLSTGFRTMVAAVNELMGIDVSE